eukprot:TRINITY_DN1837_c0_g1_i1.p1 TRINITY_DN1837_c0_g1~~TRINITY_DN1837_c0_g1_i1.p1  ORF type:complete len:744 (-),score=157.43 TRINITY_DN1837_c0_g1_i1:4-2235(-)
MADSDTDTSEHRSKKQTFEDLESSIVKTLTCLERFITKFQELRSVEKELDKELVTFYGNEGKIGNFLSSVPNALQDRITDPEADDAITYIDMAFKASVHSYEMFLQSFRDRFFIREILSNNLKKCQDKYDKLAKHAERGERFDQAAIKLEEAKKQHQEFKLNLKNDMSAFYEQRQDGLNRTLQYYLKLKLHLFHEPKIKDRIGELLERTQMAEVLINFNDHKSTDFLAFLQDQVCLSYFRSFLLVEHSEENLNFWLDNEKYKTITDKKLQRELADQIYVNYFAFGARNTLNVGSHTRSHIELMKQPNYELGPEFFNGAAKEIFELMKSDPFERFCKSDLFARLQLRSVKKNFLEYERPKEIDIDTLRADSNYSKKKLIVTGEKPQNQLRDQLRFLRRKNAESLNEETDFFPPRPHRFSTKSTNAPITISGNSLRHRVSASVDDPIAIQRSRENSLSTKQQPQLPEPEISTPLPISPDNNKRKSRSLDPLPPTNPQFSRSFQDKLPSGSPKNRPESIEIPKGHLTPASRTKSVFFGFAKKRAETTRSNEKIEVPIGPISPKNVKEPKKNGFFKNFFNKQVFSEISKSKSVEFQEDSLGSSSSSVGDFREVQDENQVEKSDSEKKSDWASATPKRTLTKKNSLSESRKQQNTPKSENTARRSSKETKKNKKKALAMLKDETSPFHDRKFKRTMSGRFLDTENRLTATYSDDETAAVVTDVLLWKEQEKEKEKKERRHTSMDKRSK